MLDIKYIREHPDAVRDSITRRGVALNLDSLLELDAERVQLVGQSEQLRSQLKIDGKPSEDQLRDLQAVKEQFEAAESKLREVTERYQDLLEQVPNLIAADTPDGGEDAKRVDRTWGKTDDLGFEPKDHLELSLIHDIVNFEAGAKVAGNKFYFLRPKAVRLWQAILRLAQDTIAEEGFEPMMVPHMVNERVAAGTGYMPKGEQADNYQDKEQGLVMIATSEIPLTAYHMDDVVDLATPLKYAGLSTCYRLEGSAYGKFAKGLYRVHQFDKLEMYTFCAAEQSEGELERIIALEEKIFQALEIPYQLTRTPSGDLSAPAYKKFDLEYYSPVDKGYRELTSCSNCTDYQARRLNIRYRNAAGKLDYAHTLNGTAVNTTRTLIAFLENHQQADGEVRIPKALQHYYGGETL